MFSYDHEIGGTGGDYIEWFTKEQFIAWKGERNAAFAIYGVKPPEKLPKVGDLLFAEFTKSYMLFKITAVRMSPDQKDTFFGEVMPVRQMPKPGNVGNLVLLEK